MAWGYGVILADSTALLRGYVHVLLKLEEGLRQQYGLDVKVFGVLSWGV